MSQRKKLRAVVLKQDQLRRRRIEEVRREITVPKACWACQGGHPSIRCPLIGGPKAGLWRIRLITEEQQALFDLEMKYNESFHRTVQLIRDAKSSTTAIGLPCFACKGQHAPKFCALLHDDPPEDHEAQGVTEFQREFFERKMKWSQSFRDSVMGVRATFVRWAGTRKYRRRQLWPKMASRAVFAPLEEQPDGFPPEALRLVPCETHLI